MSVLREAVRGSATRTWCTALLCLAVLANLALFPYIEHRTSTPNLAALNRAPEQGFFALVFESPHTRSRFDLFVALDLVAPDAVVSLTADQSGSHVALRSYLVSVGSVSDVRIVEGSGIEMLGDRDISPFVVAAGHGGTGGAPWAIAMRSVADSHVEGDDPFDFVAHELTVQRGDERPRAIGGREFVWIEVPLESPVEVYTSRILLVETSLLTGAGAPTR